jgi:alpha-amylase/alpha-mannosidase (GH57 family)
MARKINVTVQCHMLISWCCYTATKKQTKVKQIVILYYCYKIQKSQTRDFKGQGCEECQRNIQEKSQKSAEKKKILETSTGTFNSLGRGFILSRF